MAAILSRHQCVVELSYAFWDRMRLATTAFHHCVSEDNQGFTHALDGYGKCCMGTVNAAKMKNTRFLLRTALLTRLNADPELFHSRMVTDDTMWVYSHNPKSKFDSIEFFQNRIFQIIYTAYKLGLTVFWDSEGLLAEG